MQDYFLVEENKFKITSNRKHFQQKNYIKFQQPIKQYLIHLNKEKKLA